MRIRIKAIGKKQIGKYLEGNYIQPQTVGDVNKTMSFHQTTFGERTMKIQKE